MGIKAYELYQDEIHKAKIVKYVSKLPLSSHCQAAILEERAFNEITSIYLKSTQLFAAAFSINNDERVGLLNVAGFLYYRSILFLDQALDTNSSKADTTILISVCQEESIKILTSIFGLKSSFWQFWNQRRQDYLQAYHIDHVSHCVQSMEDFENLADLKTSYGKIAIDCIYLLSGKEKHSLYNDLLTSHKLFYCAFQILDDIKDLREDHARNQFNIALYFLKQELDKRGINIENCSVTDLSKYLYVLKVADSLYSKAICYLEESEKIVSCYNGLKEWVSEIQKINNTIVVQKLNIKALLHSTQVESDLSQNIGPRKGVENSIREGAEYLQQLQNEDGFWCEYYNSAGISDTWSTGFVLSFIDDASRSYFKKSKLDLALAILEQNQSSNLWGYNSEWIPDGDSTTFCLNAIKSFNNKYDSQSSFLGWLSYQNEDGGFSTYNNAETILASITSNQPYEYAKGWTNSHPCVSAAAFYYLSRFYTKNATYKKLAKYLLRVQDPSGLWPAYWWTSPIYSTCFMIKSLGNVIDSNLRSAVEKSIEPLIALQNRNGSFGDGFMENSGFYTGLFIDALCSREDIFRRHEKSIKLSVEYLLSNQMTDGSWESTAAMRMPSPNIEDPSQVNFWPIEIKSTNIRVQEFSRLYTTVVCVSGLAKYLEFADGNE